MCSVMAQALMPIDTMMLSAWHGVRRQKGNAWTEITSDRGAWKPRSRSRSARKPSLGTPARRVSRTSPRSTRRLPASRDSAAVQAARSEAASKRWPSKLRMQMVTKSHTKESSNTKSRVMSVPVGNGLHWNFTSGSTHTSQGPPRPRPAISSAPVDRLEERAAILQASSATLSRSSSLVSVPLQPQQPDSSSKVAMHHQALTTQMAQTQLRKIARMSTSPASGDHHSPRDSFCGKRFDARQTKGAALTLRSWRCPARTKSSEKACTRLVTTSPNAYLMSSWHSPNCTYALRARRQLVTQTRGMRASRRCRSGPRGRGPAKQSAGREQRAARPGMRKRGTT
mmetsp:Transcript_139015/g.387743  ORF Transcript_139015/g.387743 Transcript_139015/m.387743 type:complete len:340 (+) Transcript_139015:73-1092(+)